MWIRLVPTFISRLYVRVCCGTNRCMGSATFMFNAAQRLIVGRAEGPTATASGMDLDTNASGNVVTNTSARVRCLLLQNTLDASVHAGATNMGTGTGGLFNTGLSTVPLEYVGGGYSSGGGAPGAVKNTSWNAGVGLNAAHSYLYGDDVVWGTLGTSGLEIRSCIMYYGDNNQTGVHAATDIPIACFSFQAVPDASSLTMQWASVAGQTTSGTQGIIIATVGVST